MSLMQLKRFEEARSVLRKALPVARRVLGENHEATLQTRGAYALALYKDASTTLDDLRDAAPTPLILRAPSVARCRVPSLADWKRRGTFG